MVRVAEDEAELARLGDDVGDRLARRYKVVAAVVANIQPPEPSPAADELWNRAFANTRMRLRDEVGAVTDEARRRNRKARE